MTITLLVVGKTDENNLATLIQKYASRLQHYVKFVYTELPDLKNAKNLSENQQKDKEGILILKHVETSDFLVLFDENGKQFTSRGFAEFLQKKMNSGLKNLVFVIGGPYGFGERVLQRANQKISLSKMTFSHQMVRLFTVEQLYRGFSILRNEPYHHD
ncbi:ribosomal RNA large subunit methyltransferase H [Croceivirga lutea]|uniref:23S rRNA (pseudouridine(1915)-N(3))-methyltransferase RlmH n=1 Tax=Croceivirga lutea TaxID=1775167 RepID=UPI00163ACA39|nr:23S rRNA (pseudouridine(1915)-N(3))-methyltransferase RlmH [Croceivirga lutea]GGG47292.1 ribosomal RNA large subunit methyltransferase H [Croceivirga lutea]